MFGRWIVGGLAIALLTHSSLEAQLPRPLIPLPEEGLRVAPFFDGWYANPDGTITFSFGYSNLNSKLVEIPLGPDNFIVPKEYDGRQPTSFPIVAPDPGDGGGGGGGGARGAGGADAAAAASAAAARAPGAAGNRGRDRDRDRGVFTVTVPASFKGDVVWTLRYAGQTHSVPARSKQIAYQLSWPAAMGSTPPLLRFQPSGAAGRGPTGIQAAPLQGKVGAPVPLTIWLTDDAVHEKEPIKFGKERPGMNVTWYKHSGPGSGDVRSAEGAVPGTDRPIDDDGNLPGTGRVCDPCQSRRLRLLRFFGRKPVLLDERLSEGHGDPIAKILVVVLAIAVALPAPSQAQPADDGARRIASFKSEWPDLHARVIAIERAHGVLYGALLRDRGKVQGVRPLRAADTACQSRRSSRERGSRRGRRLRPARNASRGSHPANSGVSSGGAGDLRRCGRSRPGSCA